MFLSSHELWLYEHDMIILQLYSFLFHIAYVILAHFQLYYKSMCNSPMTKSNIILSILIGKGTKFKDYEIFISKSFLM